MLCDLYLHKILKGKKHTEEAKTADGSIKQSQHVAKTACSREGQGGQGQELLTMSNFIRNGNILDLVVYEQSQECQPVSGSQEESVTE